MTIRRDYGRRRMPRKYTFHVKVGSECSPERAVVLAKFAILALEKELPGFLIEVEVEGFNEEPGMTGKSHE